ncbi:MAG: hypothetical protein AB7G13_26240 [Lautropia sp.]
MRNTGWRSGLQADLGGAAEDIVLGRHRHRVVGVSQCRRVASTIGATRSAAARLVEGDCLRFQERGQACDAAAFSRGAAWTLVYSPRQWLTGVTVANGGVTQSTAIEYWPTGKVKKVTSSAGSYSSYGYDAAQRLTSVTDDRQ